MVDECVPFIATRHMPLLEVTLQTKAAEIVRIKQRHRDLEARAKALIFSWAKKQGKCPQTHFLLTIFTEVGVPLPTHLKTQYVLPMYPKSASKNSETVSDVANFARAQEEGDFLIQLAAVLEREREMRDIGGETVRVDTVGESAADLDQGEKSKMIREAAEKRVAEDERLRAGKELGKAKKEKEERIIRAERDLATAIAVEEGIIKAERERKRLEDREIRRKELLAQNEDLNREVRQSTIVQRPPVPSQLESQGETDSDFTDSPRGAGRTNTHTQRENNTHQPAEQLSTEIATDADTHTHPQAAGFASRCRGRGRGLANSASPFNAPKIMIGQTAVCRPWSPTEIREMIKESPSPISRPDAYLTWLAQQCEIYTCLVPDVQQLVSFTYGSEWGLCKAEFEFPQALEDGQWPANKTVKDWLEVEARQAIMKCARSKN
ncbi:uncharacterized protein LOC119474805 [Sebastes umbrosus]|uniref:uncharacterized protein LOC119474805 n=1 Tax=Sebastes umbrosus TaxID=72105 RepID=UPI0018A067B1|nr:uncharacterized protein LOC119474805 [Sebastes umbrosus]